MGKTVFIMGAGTSVCVGAPLINNFLKEAQNLLEQGEVEDLRVDFKTVFETISELMNVYAKSTINLDDIEVILGALEIGKIINAPKGKIDFNNIFSTFNRVILKTLEKKIFFPFNNDGRIYLPNEYEQFISLIKTLKQYKKEDSSILTFNYDINFDIALRYRNINPIYFLYENDQANYTDSMPVVKLHGSLNWLNCSGCNEINFFDVQNIVQTSFANKKNGNHNIEVTPFLKKIKCSHCGFICQNPEPFIIPPLFNKTDHHLKIQNVWKRAAIELAEADNIVVIGYSLRESDYFFKYLYALGSVSMTRIKKFIVINPENSAVEAFRKIIGGDLQNKFFPVNGKFDNCKDGLINMFEVFQRKGV